MKRIYYFTHLSHYLALISGLGYYFVIHYLKVDTQYGLRPHSSQGAWQAIHILVVPALIFAVGLLWKDHIYLKYSHRVMRKRKSGLILIVSFFLMSISGYIIQVSSSFDRVELIKNFHFYSSLVWSLAYGVHQLLRA